MLLRYLFKSIIVHMQPQRKYQPTCIMQYNSDNRNQSLKEALYNCSICNYTTTNTYKFQRHLSSVHQKIKDFQCDDCEYSSLQKRILTKHIKAVHIELKDFRCGNSPYIASHKPTLTHHIKSVHNKVNDY